MDPEYGRYFGTSALIMDIDEGAGDKGTGSIPRQDVATVVLACIDGASKPNVTFEIYSDKTEEVKDLTGLSSLLPDELK